MKGMNIIMKNVSKKMISLLMGVLTLCSVFVFPTISAEAATKSCGMIVNVFDGGRYYSGRYECDSHSDFGKVGLFGKSVKIEFVNFCSQLNSSQVNFYKKYARFNVCVSSNGIVKKFYNGKKLGEKFTIPKGKNMTVWIHSEIDSSGWDQFEKQMKKGLPWSFAQYRLKY